MALQPHLYPSGKEAGTDEAGRGCLAGPVFAAAVILPLLDPLEGLNDSKKLRRKDRETWREYIESASVSWAVAFILPEVIDRINILQSSILAMHQALEGLAVIPDRILVDGNRFLKFHNIEHHCIIGGDAKYLSIAAASVLAKTHRDAYMLRIHEDYPMYGWDRNKGYPTPDHIRALRIHGPSPHHRLSFSVKGQTRMPF